LNNGAHLLLVLMSVAHICKVPETCTYQRTNCLTKLLTHTHLGYFTHWDIALPKNNHLSFRMRNGVHFGALH